MKNIIILLMWAVILCSCEKEVIQTPQDTDCWLCQQTDIATSILGVDGNYTYQTDTIVRPVDTVCNMIYDNILTYELSFYVDTTLLQSRMKCIKFTSHE